MIRAQVMKDNTLYVNESIVADSVQYECVQFKFSEDWNDYTKTAVFRKDESEECFNVLLSTNDTCYVPFEVIKVPAFYISVFGVNEDSIITATEARVKIKKSGYKEGEAPKEPTPTEYQQVIKIMQDTEAIAQSVRDDADAGKFDGEQGPPGPQGERGEQYVLTEEDKQEIATIVMDEVINPLEAMIDESGVLE